MVVDQIRMLDGLTPLQSVRPMAFVAMAVESECLLLLEHDGCGFVKYASMVDRKQSKIHVLGRSSPLVGCTQL